MTNRRKHVDSNNISVIKNAMSNKGYTDVKVKRGVRKVNNRTLKGYYISSNELSDQFVLKSRVKRELKVMAKLDQDKRNKLINLNRYESQSETCTEVEKNAIRYVRNKSILYEPDSILYTISSYKKKHINELTFEDINEFREYVGMFERISYGKRI